MQMELKACGRHTQPDQLVLSAGKLRINAVQTRSGVDQQKQYRGISPKRFEFSGKSPRNALSTRTQCRLTDGVLLHWRVTISWTPSTSFLVAIFAQRNSATFPLSVSPKPSILEGTRPAPVCRTARYIATTSGRAGARLRGGTASQTSLSSRPWPRCGWGALQPLLARRTRSPDHPALRRLLYDASTRKTGLFAHKNSGDCHQRG